MENKNNNQFTIRPEWQDDGDDGVIYLCIEDNGERLFGIRLEDVGTVLAPVQLFHREMVLFR